MAGTESTRTGEQNTKASSAMRLFGLAFVKVTGMAWKAEPDRIRIGRRIE